MKIINYPFRHIVKASELAKLFQEATAYNVNSVGPLIVSGLQVSHSGLAVTVTKGNGFCGEVTLPWIYNLESFSTSFSPVDKWNPAVVLNADTTLNLPPNATSYLVLQSTISSTTPYQDEYVTTDTLQIVSSLTTTLPDNNLIGELAIAEIVTDATSVTSVTNLTGSIASLGLILSQLAALQLTVTQLSSQVKTAVQYDAATNTPDITTETLATLEKKLIFVKNDGVVNINGTPTQLWHGDIVTSDGATLIVNSQKFWQN